MINWPKYTAFGEDAIEFRGTASPIDQNRGYLSWWDCIATPSDKLIRPLCIDYDLRIALAPWRNFARCHQRLGAIPQVSAGGTVRVAHFQVNPAFALEFPAGAHQFDAESTFPRDQFVARIANCRPPRARLISRFARDTTRVT